MTKMRLLLLATIVLLTNISPVLAQKKAKQASNVADTSKTTSGITTKSYQEVLKGAQTTSGMFTVHKVGGDYFFEIPDSLMRRDILIVNKISGVPYELNDAGLNRGMNYENKLIRFSKDKEQGKVWVTIYDAKVSVPEDAKIAQSVYDNYRESVIEQFPIETYSSDSMNVVINVNKIFDGSEKSFNDLFNSISLGSSVKKEFSKIEFIKTFPQNIVVKSLLSTSVAEGNNSVPLTVQVTTNLVLLDKEPMKPRFADTRIGYFSTPHLYFSDTQQKVETREFVNRWKLEPKAEDVDKYLRGELVEPKKQIVFYIDPATPALWQQQIKAGVHDWQAAFESAGFKNAIVAKDVDPNDKDFDMDDVRYSVITYAASQQANAMGPSVIDPRSGEIIEADIVWWHNVMTLLQSWMRVQTSAIDPAARPNVLSDQHMAHAIRFVSSHELGHTLGLMHNMGASFSFPVDSLRSKTFTATMGGTASSIMDYARFNYVAQPEDGVEEITPVIGAYDKYAVNWAYRWLPEKTAHAELPILNGWIREHENDPMYWYGEQQDAKDPVDPRSQDEDLGDNAVLASQYGLKNLKRIMPNIENWTQEDGQGYFEAGKLLMGVINQWKLYSGHVMTNVGGFYINNPVKGHNVDRYIPVDKKRQRESVRYLIDEVFVTPTWLFDAEIWKKAYPVRTSPTGEVEYSAYGVARELQYATYYDLLKDARLLRMYEVEATKGKNESYTPEQMLSDIHEAIFEGSAAAKNLTLHQRMSQKNFVDALIVSSNKAVEKTTKKALGNSHATHSCCYATKEAAFDIPPRPEVGIRNLNYYPMTRVSEAVSVKRGELIRVLKIAEKRKTRGDMATQNHYEDLIIRIKEALNI